MQKTKKQKKEDDVLSDVTIDDAITDSKSVAKPKSKATKRKLLVVADEQQEQDDDAKGKPKRAKSTKASNGNGKVKKVIVDEPFDPSLRRSSRLRN